MLSHEQCSLSRSKLSNGLLSGAWFKMPELRFLGNFCDLSKLHFFFTIFSKLLAHWSFSWLGDFVNLRWLCLKQWGQCLQLSLKVSSSGNFYSRYYSLSQVSLSLIVQKFILLYSAEFISLKAMQFLLDWSVSIVRLNKSDEANFIFTSIEVYVH